jgi:uncharacterized metal-binding protein YceD (DUF177 family)
MTETDIPLDWTLGVDAVPERGGALTYVATEAERTRVAHALALESLSALTFAGRIDRLAGGRYRVTGRVKAVLEQSCVVTLEPLPARLDEDLDVEFKPLNTQTSLDDVQIELDEASDVEPITNGRLETGRVVYETLSAGLNPYPRKAGEAFDDMIAAPKGADTSKENPFAVLAKLKPKS